MSDPREARWEARRRAVRQVWLAVGVLLLLAVAFAVWLALDAPDTRAEGSSGAAPSVGVPRGPAA